MKKHYFDLMRLWVQSYFKHPVENIRQANPIVPGTLYGNFGNVCKAVPMTAEEKRYISDSSNCQALDPHLLEDIERSGNGLQSIRQLQQSMDHSSNIPARCNLCDFYKKGIPCPIHNVLKDGTVVCESHRYIIIKPVSHV